MVHIGTYTLPSNILLAPLSGCADLSFRLIARSCGAQFAFYEMIDASALLHNNPETYSILKSEPSDVPIGVQLLGSDPDQMVDAAQKLLQYISTPFLDITCACPVKKVIKKKAGAYLIKSPHIIAAMVKKLISSLSIPITIKLRIGFNSYHENQLLTVIREIESAGASALFIHGRTRSQGYSGAVNYEAIKCAVNNVSIPVFGSGNIFTVSDAHHMLQSTGCAGLLVARGAFGNPWLLKDIEDYTTTGLLPSSKSLEQKIAVLKKHLSYVNAYYKASPSGKIGFMRKIAQWYLTDFKQARKIRNTISAIRDYEELLKLIEQLESLNNSPTAHLI